MGRSSSTSTTNILQFGVCVMCCIFFHHHLEYQSRVVHSLYHLHKALKELHVEDVKVRFSHDHTATEMKRVRDRLQHQWDFMCELTLVSKGNWIRIKGVPEDDTGEEKQSQIEERIYDLIRFVGLEYVQITDIERANRIGKKQVAKKTGVASRMIVAELSSGKLKTKFIEESTRKLRNTGYFVSDLSSQGCVMPQVDVPDGEAPFAEVFVEESNPAAFKSEVAKKLQCGYIKEIGPPEPVAKNRKIFGAWMQDPVGLGDSVWLIENFQKNFFLEEYASIKDLQSKRVRRKMKLPFYFGGTGHAVYNNSLYFNRFNSTSIVRYDLSKQQVLNERSLPGAVAGNLASYSWAGYTDFDFNVDEEGLWLIYSTYDNGLDIVVSKLDPIELEPMENEYENEHHNHRARKERVFYTYKTNWKKVWSANAFTACGVLYTVQKFDQKDTILNFVYDTHRKRSKHIKIPFSSRYKFLSSLSYNHKLRQLFAWDKGHMVRYDVRFHEPNDQAFFAQEIK